MVTVKTESEDLPEPRSTSVDHHHRDNHMKHAHHHSPSAETRQASPNAALLAVFLLDPYFSGLLFVVENIIAKIRAFFPCTKDLPLSTDPEGRTKQGVSMHHECLINPFRSFAYNEFRLVQMYKSDHIYYKSEE